MPSYYVVYENKAKKPGEITFQIIAGAPTIPAKLSSLQLEFANAETVLKIIYPNTQDYRTPFESLLSLAQVGLAGNNPQIKIARDNLKQFKNDIVLKEGKRIKNGYWGKLGINAFILAALPWPIVWIGHYPKHLVSIAMLWSGCMAGVWLSFGMRKAILSYDDLGQLEKDQMDPLKRLIFCGILAIFVGLYISTQATKIIIADYSLSAPLENPLVALLLGACCGISEIVLPKMVGKMASGLINTFKRLKMTAAD